MKIGSLSWKLKYQARRRPWLYLLPLIFLLMMVPIGCQLLVQDQPEGTTALQKKTGQPIADGWVYSGEDSEGNLIFQKGDQIVLLPPESEELVLEGKRYQVAEHSADSVNIEPVSSDSSSLSFPWGILWLLGGIAIGFSLRRTPPRPRRKWQKARW